MMVTVAVVALLFYLELWRRRSPYCRQRAVQCALAQTTHLWLAECHEKTAALYRDQHASAPESGVRYNIEQSVIFIKASWSERAKAQRSADRAEAFRRAAMYPWFPMPPEGNDPLERNRPEQPERAVLPAPAQKTAAAPVGLRPIQRRNVSGR
jgi:hypothetical protein